VFSYGNKITEIIQSLGVTDDRIIEIPTGIEKSWLSNKIPTSDVLNFLFIGRYERRKGIEELNLALKSLLPNELFHFHFIGPIPPCGKILSDKITYHGSVMESERIKEITDSCQVLVTPSHSERNTFTF